MTQKKTYAQIKKELDEVMLAFETSSHDDVDEMLEDYEKAHKIIKELDQRLQAAKMTLKKLNSK